MHEPDLRVLIVSDAHFGWTDATQPPPRSQSSALEKIVAANGNTHLLIDTGDAHHGGLDLPSAESARQNWTSIIANAMPHLPFLYVPGNHEMLDFRGEDAEWRSCLLGSLGLRPFWSFDFRGVHFVSVPQMRRVNLVNREMLEWLACDLARNRDKTTILLAHQALLGTTFNNGELDYRALVNSDEIFALLDQHRQVKAWMHGHNHNFEVVQRDQRLYVSNGRMGGFIPPAEWGDFGQPSLGSVLLEIAPDSVRVRCFDATNGRFFTQPNLSGALKTRTTVDLGAPTQFSMGLGLASGGAHRPLNRHFAARGGLQIAAQRAQLRALNDDPALRLSCPLWGDRGSKRIERGEQATVLIHSLVLAPAHNWSTSSAGLLLTSKPDIKTAPIVLLAPGRQEQKTPYFPVTDGAEYRLCIALSAAARVLISVRTLLRQVAEDEPIATALPLQPIDPDKKEVTIDFMIAPAAAQTSAMLLGFEITLNSVAQRIEIHRIELYRLPNAQPSHLALGLPGMPPIALNPTGFATQRMNVDDRLESGTLQLSGGDGWPMVIALTQLKCDFQVRNAAVIDHGDHLEIGPMTSTWSPESQICIARLLPSTAPFVCATRNIERLLLFPLERSNRLIKMKLIEFTAAAEVDVLAAAALPASGANWLRAEGDRQVYRVSAAEITFG